MTDPSRDEQVEPTVAETVPDETVPDETVPNEAAPEAGEQQAAAPRPGEPAEPTPEATAEPEPVGEEDELAAVRRQLEERTNDLQRLQAEFVNYKRRVERDRERIVENATYAALAPIVEVLDTVDRAREHAEKSGQSLDPGFRATADQLERVVSGVGLAKFGAPGEPFDPTIHEALSHIGEDPEVEVTTCKVIAKAGYRIGDRVVRAAQVLVVDPASS